MHYDFRHFQMRGMLRQSSKTQSLAPVFGSPAHPILELLRLWSFVFDLQFDLLQLRQVKFVFGGQFRPHVKVPERQSYQSVAVDKNCSKFKLI